MNSFKSKILIITDRKSKKTNNGKRCHEIFIGCETFYITNDNFDLEILKDKEHVLFDFNEDLRTYSRGWNNDLKKFNSANDMIKRFINIKNQIKNHNRNIKIYNNPESCHQLGDKYQTMELLKNYQCQSINFPKYKMLKRKEDIKNINFYPCIVKLSNDDLGKEEEPIAKNEEELYKIFEKLFPGNIICIEYMNPFIKSLNSYFSLRINQIYNVFIDYFLTLPKFIEHKATSILSN